MVKRLAFLLFTASIAGVAVGAELQVSARDLAGKPLQDAVVYAELVGATPLPAAGHGPAHATIDQVNKEFVPHVTVIRTNTEVTFPNSDNIRHQVYSFSPAKKFELPLYARTDAPPVTFDKPGVVVLGCNIHDWMIGYVYVSETPFFAKTGPAGTATLSDMPPGEYAVRIWHPSMDRAEETTSRHVILAAEPAGEEWQLGLKPNIRVPRVSGAASPSYP